MAYPNILYKGQYTLKRVLTMPADAAITADNIGDLVTVNAAGDVVVAGADAAFFGVLRTINVNDNVATVDFSGVHEFDAAGAIDAGSKIAVASGTTVKVDATGAATNAIALVQAADTEKVQVFFLN